MASLPDRAWGCGRVSVTTQVSQMLRINEEQRRPNGHADGAQESETTEGYSPGQ
jgi:hypothetical protein